MNVSALAATSLSLPNREMTDRFGTVEADAARLLEEVRVLTEQATQAAREAATERDAVIKQAREL